MGPTISFICPWELSFQSRTIMKLFLMIGNSLPPIFLFFISFLTFQIAHLQECSFFPLLPTHFRLKCMPCRSFEGERSPTLLTDILSCGTGAEGWKSYLPDSWLGWFLFRSSKEELSRNVWKVERSRSCHSNSSRQALAVRRTVSKSLCGGFQNLS